MDFKLVHQFATLILLLLFSASASSNMNLTDKEALLSFKALINDPSSSLSSWNESTTVCKWQGVSCNKAQERVSGLDLQGLGLQGSISPQIGNLSSLNFLYLQDNQLSGTIPSQLGFLSSLNMLNISSNQIYGLIPQSILNCQELTVLDLSNNLITGSIPQELELLSRLQIMKLGQNRLNGAIPNSIGNLSSLTFLDLGTNTLTGGIPNELGDLHKLQHLQLSINNLTGNVPPSLYNLSSLVFFALASNSLHGEIPGDVGFRLPNLLLFHFCFNEFTGPIPPSLHNITRIQSLRMSHNFHVGSVPPGLNMLSELTMYNIGYNRLVSSGSTTDGLHLITSLTNSSNLGFLAFDGNLFEGVIPDSVGNLSTSLSKLYMGHNGLFGSIPKSIGRLTKLTLLNIEKNLISGEIPQEISKLSELQMLGLAGNRLEGSIPVALGNLSKLNKLDLFDNSLTGSIPVTFASYQLMQSLDLSSNKLNGSIPKEIFSIASLSSLMNISRNQLSGPLPVEVGRLENVVAVDLSENFLSGDIPESIGKCHSLQTLSVANNSFTGSIPKQIADLKGLQSLDLSSNQLSGPIPSDFGKLQGLQSLNLSFNDLQGVIPNEGIFKNASRVHLQGNSKLCNSSLPWCLNSKSGQNKSRLIVILSITSFTFILVLLACLLFVRRTRGGSHAKASPKSNAFKGQHPLISYEELLQATENFSASNLMGTGSFGSVFRGVLRDGMVVAIKVLNLGTQGAVKSFMAECEALKNTRHRNLIKLITCCSSLDFGNKDFIALVYEFMSGGNLEDWIHTRGLSIVERLNIAIDVASAMDYLHNDCNPPVVHCDLKPSNVLLDGEKNAKVGDFGLAKLLLERSTEDQQEPTSSTNRIKGSIGYIPPEYGFGGRASTRGDVYSYGVMLLELLTGKSPTHEVFQQDLSLEKWVRAAFPDRIMEVMDPQLLTTFECSNEGLMISPEKQHGCMLSMVKVGLDCATESPEARIGMRDVIHQLNGIKDILIKSHLDFKLL